MFSLVGEYQMEKLLNEGRKTISILSRNQTCV